MLTALSMLALASGLFGDGEGGGSSGDGADLALAWWVGRSRRSERSGSAGGVLVDRALTDEVIAVVRGWRAPTAVVAGPAPALAAAWARRAAALVSYGRLFGGSMDVEAVLESLLHMHHNRALGVDRGSEVVCRRLARQAAVTAMALGGHR